MLQSNLLSLVLASLLAFSCGYFVGVKKGKSERFVDVAELKVEDETERHDPVSAPSEAPSDTVDSAPRTDEASSEQAVETPDSFEQRLASGAIILTDTKGRTIEVTILEVSNGAMKVRRQIDGMVVDVPLSMLSGEDRKFADYLRETGQFAQKKTTTPSSSENFKFDSSVGPETRKILEELFGGFE
jgi:hypothetical protein